MSIFLFLKILCCKEKANLCHIAAQVKQVRFFNENFRGAHVKISSIFAKMFRPFSGILFPPQKNKQ